MRDAAHIGVHWYAFCNSGGDSKKKKLKSLSYLIIMAVEKLYKENKNWSNYG